MYALSLDFDGVLHPFGSRGAALFGKLHLIHELMEKYPAVHVMVHSSWREVHSAEDLKEMLFGSRHDLADRFLGVTPVEIMSRWESIEAWAWRNKPTSICVLDDEPRMFPSYIVQNKDPRIRFIECATLLGLMEGNPALDAWARSTLLVEV